MSALAIRTVRRLDERSEVKEVAGFKIEAGIPIPPRIKAMSPLRSALAALEVGESLVAPNHANDGRAWMAHNYPGRIFTSRCLGPNRYRIWRTA